MVPLTALGTTSYTTGPGTIKRFNMFTTAAISAVAAPGYSSGEAMAAMQRIAREHLPENIGLEWSGLLIRKKGRWTDWIRVGAGISFRLPFSSCPI